MIDESQKMQKLESACENLIDIVPQELKIIEQFQKI